MLEWTGERFIPGEGGTALRYEHVHRYSALQRFVAKKRVLDLGSGEGYGSAILAKYADSVVGVDVDQEAVHHAQTSYPMEGRVSFKHVSPGRLPFNDEEFDVVTCFEVIEHLAEPEDLLPEIARVLKKSGLLIISTPNRRLYSDERSYQNEFHLHEFYISEFRDFLGTQFANVRFLAQRLIATSAIWDFEIPLSGQSLAIVKEINPRDGQVTEITLEPMYIVALCSNGDVPSPEPSFLVTDDQALTKEMDGSVPHSEVRRLLDAMQEERTKAQNLLNEWEAELLARANALRAADQEINRLVAKADSLEAFVSQTQVLQGEVTMLRRKLIELAEELRRAEKTDRSRSLSARDEEPERARITGWIQNQRQA